MCLKILLIHILVALMNFQVYNLAAESTKHLATFRYAIGSKAALSAPKKHFPRSSQVTFNFRNVSLIQFIFESSSTLVDDIDFKPSSNSSWLTVSVPDVTLDHAGLYVWEQDNFMYRYDTWLFVYGSLEKARILRNGSELICTANSSSRPMRLRPKIIYTWYLNKANGGKEIFFSELDRIDIPQYSANISCEGKEEKSIFVSPPSEVFSIAVNEDIFSGYTSQVTTSIPVEDSTVSLEETDNREVESNHGTFDLKMLIPSVFAAFLLITIIIIGCLYKRKRDRHIANSNKQAPGRVLFSEGNVDMSPTDTVIPPMSDPNAPLPPPPTPVDWQDSASQSLSSQIDGYEPVYQDIEENLPRQVTGDYSYASTNIARRPKQGGRSIGTGRDDYFPLVPDVYITAPALASEQPEESQNSTSSED